ncbi:cation diffusion facilitator family transporter [Bacteroidota bacterium]
MSETVKAARFSIYSNSLLIILKTIAGLISGSVSIISEAIHSVMDLFASIIAYFSIKISNKPPDHNHPYGHGKFENASGVIEAILIFIAAIWIIYEAVEKIREPNEIESFGIGFSVMLFAGIVNYFISRYLYRISNKFDSIALKADALHLKTDAYTSIGVCIGILLIWITGINILDSIFAIGIALLIMNEAFVLLKKAYSPLMDHALPEREEKMIKKIIEKHIDNFHHFRTRKAGDKKFVDFHLEMKGDISLQKAHDKCDDIENEIKSAIENIEVTIHVETFESK